MRAQLMALGWGKNLVCGKKKKKAQTIKGKTEKQTKMLCTTKRHYQQN